MFLVLSFLGLLLAALVKFTIRKHRIMKYVRHLPAPFEYPIIGSSISFVGKNNQRMFDWIVDSVRVTWFQLLNFEDCEVVNFFLSPRNNDPRYLRKLHLLS